jgi:hypothetical protein
MLGKSDRLLPLPLLVSCISDPDVGVLVIVLTVFPLPMLARATVCMAVVAKRTTIMRVISISFLSTSIHLQKPSLEKKVYQETYLHSENMIESLS